MREVDRKCERVFPRTFCLGSLCIFLFCFHGTYIEIEIRKWEGNLLGKKGRMCMEVERRERERECEREND